MEGYVKAWSALHLEFFDMPFGNPEAFKENPRNLSLDSGDSLDIVKRR